MLARVIQWSIQNRVLVLVVTVLVTGWGVYSLRLTPLDAMPDLSDVQVVIRTPYPGQSPTVVEDQLTYPISTIMLAVPGASVVRGYSFFGDSYVYVIFDDETDLYWARSRVLEYLNQAAARLPGGVQPRLGPDATGVGWVYSYALVDRTGGHDLAQLRSIQDWFLKYELQSIPGVAEVASVGGMVRQYQVVADPQRLRAYQVPLTRLAEAIRKGNESSGGSTIELAEAEYMISTRGYLTSQEDIESIPVAQNRDGTPLLLRDVAKVQTGPEMRRVVADLDGDGEVTGGIVVMRQGENALETIARVKRKLNELKAGLPQGVEIVETYDRSGLILRAVENLNAKLLQELAVVALVCLVFLWYLPSALVAMVSLPLGILIAFIMMRHQGVNANIMSLGGIAIAIGAMVDAAIVMLENAHKQLERWHDGHPGACPTPRQRWQLITQASVEVGPALFFSLLIITFSFLPVFVLQGQEGRMFSPLVYTKTYAMAAAAGLAVTLVPVLMGYFISGRPPAEQSNPLSRWLIALYRPLLQRVLARPRIIVWVAVLAGMSTVLPVAGVSGLLTPLKWPTEIAGWVLGPAEADSPRVSYVARINHWQSEVERAWRHAFHQHPALARFAAGVGSEFMPELDEGDLMYMPTTLPGLSIGKAQELLQQTDRLIASIPEVKRVFGKIGRADTATDPAPLTMIETLIQLKPHEQWRPGLTLEGLIEELDRTVNLPGLANAWVMPIKTRINMLATGIKTMVGIKVSGPDLATIEALGQRIEKVVRKVPGTTSAYAERVSSGRYVEILPRRQKAALLGLNIADINAVTSAAVGGMTVTETVEGAERYAVNLRFGREFRDDLEKLKQLPLQTASGIQVPLAQVAEVRINQGPAMIKSENARPHGWVFVDMRGMDLGSYIRMARRKVAEEVLLPPGYSVSWSGQYEQMQSAEARLRLAVPMTLLIIFLLLYLTFRRIGEALLVMATLPFALVGGFWLLFALGYHMSVATAVGFIALAGVAAEFGVIMLVYLDQAISARQADGRLHSLEDLKAAIMEGAVLRVRPKAMTVSVIIAGLLPIMVGGGTGSEVMQRIAAPMVGGMITAPLLSLFVVPVVYLLWKGRGLRQQ